MNKKIKVSHEVPFDLLDLSTDFNDYDYCLPHLLDESEQYLEYFTQAKQQGRYIIMDNSLHELGTAYDTERLLHWINVLKQSKYNISNLLENKNIVTDLIQNNNLNNIIILLSLCDDIKQVEYFLENYNIIIDNDFIKILFNSIIKHFNMFLKFSPYVETSGAFLIIKTLNKTKINNFNMLFG